MAVFDSDYVVRRRGWWRRVWRDVCLMRLLLRIVWTWFWKGGRMRRRYAAKAAAGEIYWLDAPES